MNVITGYFRTFKEIQDHIFVSTSNILTKICVLLYTINMPNIKKISQTVSKISLESTNFEVSSLGVTIRDYVQNTLLYTVLVLSCLWNKNIKKNITYLLNVDKI